MSVRMGCFWGAERKFWNLKGVYSTQVGYAGGYTPNPTYKEDLQNGNKFFVCFFQFSLAHFFKYTSDLSLYVFRKQ
ncbi:hypothetical protein FD755_019839 [Muntiacus reevesi]|uniref:peptide-methionine (S)-S-oxide reductase n=1 Tax=Muntiacus reevesi TaxID=9886 RepID=A0A5N3X528_MUNRE|nr:hypothetical protein FD755_019839 [Muntiacus reevesi]